MRKYLIPFIGAALLLTACTGSKQASSEVPGSELQTTVAEASSSQEDNKNSEGYSVTDITGREVSFAKVPEKVIALGHGTLKFYTYVAGSDKLIGIEEAEKTGHTVTGQSIHYAYPDLKELPTIGKGGPKFEPDYERLKYSEPDVIFIAYENTKEELDELQSKLEIPVVGLGAGMNGKIFEDDTYNTFEIIGKVMKMEDRAEKINSFLKEVQQDLEKRGGNISESPKTYIGGCSYRGAQGILSTRTHLDLFNSPKVYNVMDELTEEKNAIIDKEKLVEINPELIILDLSGKELLDEDMKADPDFYKSLDAFKNKKAYYIMPYFTYGMNFDTALLDMYYMGSLAHPDNYSDVDIANKAAEIYTVFVGKDVYNDLMGTYPESFKESNVE